MLSHNGKNIPITCHLMTRDKLSVLGKMSNVAHLICMYVYLYVCMYVCMYVCLYVCMYVCMYVRMYVCMDVRVYVCFFVCLFVYLLVCFFVSLYLSLGMYVCPAWPCTYTPTTQKYNMERHSASNILQHPRFNCHRQTLASALAPTLLCCAAPRFADRLLYGQATGRHASSLDRAKRGKALNLCRATCKRACVVPTERRTSSAPTRIRL